MTFTSATFFLFLVGVLVLYWSLPQRRVQNALLIGASYTFYGWWDVRFCLLMLGSSLIDFYVAIWLERSTQIWRRRALVGISLAVNIGLLGFFKYYNFFAASLTEVLRQVGVESDLRILEIVLPVGISFYTFQTLGYTLDVYATRLAPSRKLVDYLAFVSFFPQLVAGPIERAPNLLPQFQSPRLFDYELAVTGARLMLWGFFKKMVLADNVASIVDDAYADPSAKSGPLLLFATVCFAFQIYWDFSGYSDIAVGTARLFGFRLMRNFATPYFSQSVGEFWRRWHISLSTWFRDYLYIPLGGSKVGPWRRASNLLVTFAVSGLWHGASWNFVVWGLVNGVAVVPSALRGRRFAGERETSPPQASRAMVTARMLRTFTIISCSWVFFRAASMSDALDVLSRVVTGIWSREGWSEVALTASLGNRPIGLGLGVVAIAAEWFGRPDAMPLRLRRLTWGPRWLSYIALTWLVLTLGTFVSGQFIYFQF